jgi:hypothetical protein
MDVTMIGLQNAGKTSLLRVLSVSSSHHPRDCGCGLTGGANRVVNSQLSKWPSCVHSMPYLDSRLNSEEASTSRLERSTS